jgi:cytochrome c oxidase assembly protein subunit 17
MLVPKNPSCCACPKTKSARDDCFLKFDGSEADEKCKALVQEHLACMRGLGFKI